MPDYHPKVSIIIPVYNTAKHLSRCLKSVVTQTLSEIEIILINDGSTDKSISVVDAFAKKDSRIVIINQRNQGVSVARNNGLRVAKGEYVGFVDSDDSVDAAYFENLYNTAKKEKADMVSGFVKMNDDRRQHFYNYTNKRATRFNRCSLMGVVWLNLYKRSILSENSIFFPSNLRTAEDNLFNLRATYFANKVVAADDDSVFYNHITRETSLTAQQYKTSNLIPLSIAVLETITELNRLDDYDKDVYISRVYDTVNFLYQRYTALDNIGIYRKYKISNIISKSLLNTKYRVDVLSKLRENDIYLKKLIYGLKAKNLLEEKPHKKKNFKQSIKYLFKKSTIKHLIKKVIKFILPHGLVVAYKERRENSNVKAAEIDPKKIAIIAAYPETKYFEIVKKAASLAGYRTSDRVSDAKYVWLHWYENGVSSYADLVKKVSSIERWRSQGRKVIFHIHNKKPHESKAPNVSHALMAVLADCSDHVSIMSSATEELLKDTWYYGEDFSHVSKVPHPNYIGVYGDAEKATSLNGQKLKILFFGLIRPYKGIEHLLAATEGLKDVEVSIIGKPSKEEYADEIRALCAHRDNVTIRFEHIKDKEIPKIFAEHHILALPYNIDSSLNSGAALLALSYGRTVVGTNNGTLKDIKNSKLYFGYDYSDEADHPIQLKKTIESIQSKYRGDSNKLLEIGDNVLKLVKQDNSIEKVSQSIQEMIERIR